MLLEDLAAVGMTDIPPNIHVEVPSLQAMGPVPEAPVAEAWIPQAGLQELSYGTAGEGQPFLDPGRQGFYLLSLIFYFRVQELSRVLVGWKH